MKEETKRQIWNYIINHKLEDNIFGFIAGLLASLVILPLAFFF